MDESTTHIGLRLKASRIAAGFRAACAFAEHHNIPVSTYSQHENGKRVLSAEMLLHYSEILDISPGWLLSGQGYPYLTLGDVSDKLRILERELLSLGGAAAYTLPKDSLSTIDSAKAWVDVQLFRDVLLRLVPLAKDDKLDISDHDLIDFAVEVYNGVVTTTTSEADKLAMVDLSITSLKRGALKQVTQDKRVKRA